MLPAWSIITGMHRAHTLAHTRIHAYANAYMRQLSRKARSCPVDCWKDSPGPDRTDTKLRASSSCPPANRVIQCYWLAESLSQCIVSLRATKGLPTRLYLAAGRNGTQGTYQPGPGWLARWLASLLAVDNRSQAIKWSTVRSLERLIGAQKRSDDQWAVVPNQEDCV